MELLFVAQVAYVYEDPATPVLDATAVASFLSETSGVRTRVRREFLAYHGRNRDLIAEQLARTRVVDASRPFQERMPMEGEVRFERRGLDDPSRRVSGVLYDGPRLASVLRALLPPPERKMSVAHVVFTSRLLGSFDADDRRYHARSLVGGFPGLISTSGLVEAPAKPKEFYAARRQLGLVAADLAVESLKKALGDRFLDYDDPRTTEVAKGYALQALVHQMTAAPFCDDPDCRLFNAHWQEEMLRAQVKSGRLCAVHEAFLAKHRTRGTKRPPRSDTSRRPRPRGARNPVGDPDTPVRRTESHF